jgi:chromate transport protein ChrA
MALSWIYAAYGNVGIVEALFFGSKAAVLAIVMQAVVRVGKRALKNDRDARAGGHRLPRDLLSSTCRSR